MTPGLYPILAMVAVLALLAGFLLGMLAGRGNRISRDELERQLDRLQAQNDHVAELRRREAAEQNRILQESLVERFRNVENSFRELAHSSLELRRDELSQANGRQLEALLSPFREHLALFSRQVENLRSASIEEGRQLRGEIVSLGQRSAKIGEETARLASALSAGSKSQGLFGEKVLANLLEASGLRNGLDYSLQQAVRDDAGNIPADMRLVPDAVVRLPSRNVMLIIDSKASYTAYIESCRDDIGEAARKKFLQAHVRSLRQHIGELVRKDYAANWRKTNSSAVVECVMMFVPSEAALQAALEAAPGLWSEACRQGVILTGPANFIVALKMVEITWRRVDLNARTAEILEEVHALAGAVKKFQGDFEAVGQRLRQCGEAYDQLRKSLEGNGKNSPGLIGITRHMVEMRGESPDARSTAAGVSRMPNLL